MNQMTVGQLFDTARQQHQAGRLAEAQSLYQQILTQEPDHADALHLLGYAQFQAGHAQQGLELIRRAIALDGGRAEYHCNLGVVLAAMNQHAEAIAACKQALALRPDFAEAAYNLAGSLVAVGDVEQGITMYRQALALRPDWPEAYTNLGNALQAADRLEEAVAALGQAVALRPNFADAVYNLGNALGQLERWEEAVAALRRAIAIKPVYPEAYNNLGNALRKQRQFEQAIAAYRQALQQRPDYGDAYNNLANALVEMGRIDEAIAAHTEALKLRPDDGIVHFNLAAMLLRLGRLEEAWPHYEWRWRVEEFHQPMRQLEQPMWDGSDLKGKRILLHTEQGFGDAIQFARYVPVVVRKGGKVIIECAGQMARLYASSPAIEQVIVAGQPLPEFEVHCPLLSVPYVLGTTLQTLPRQVPYLWFDVALAEQWRKRIGDTEGKLKAGLVWTGRPKPEPDRSIPLTRLAPLAQVRGVRFYSLQIGPGAEQARQPPAGMDLVDWADDLNDFADTAALMANLDLILTIDSATAHLAGALAKPTWVLLPKVPDWRWMLNRDDSLWYPTMRLFRQPIAGDWDTPIRRIVEALRSLRQA